jgi:hypothetical protein
MTKGFQRKSQKEMGNATFALEKNKSLNSIGDLDETFSNLFQMKTVEMEEQKSGSTKQNKQQINELPERMMDCLDSYSEDIATESNDFCKVTHLPVLILTLLMVLIVIKMMIFVTGATLMMIRKSSISIWQGCNARELEATQTRLWYQPI